MDRDTAVAEIKRGLGFRQTQTTSIIAALQQAQRILETGRTLPDWMIEYDQVISVTADNPVFALPTGFLRLHDDYDLYYVNSDSARVFIPRKNYTEAYQAFIASGTEDDSAVDTETSTFPSVWVQHGRTAGLFLPTPTTSFTAYLTAYKAGALLTTNIENVWLANAPDMLIGLAGINIAGSLRDKDAVTAFTTRYKMGLGSFMGEVVENELAGRPLIMGRNN